jgi:hypothetical protein
MGQGLVLEIQRDALDKDVPVTTLLRKVRLAAAKLQLTIVEEWVGHELNGYTGELPAYRKTRGTPTVWNPYHGWQPVGGDVAFLEIASEVQISESLASIEAALKAKSDGGSSAVRECLDQHRHDFIGGGAFVFRDTIDNGGDHAGNLGSDLGLETHRHRPVDATAFAPPASQ